MSLILTLEKNKVILEANIFEFGHQAGPRQIAGKQFNYKEQGQLLKWLRETGPNIVNFIWRSPDVRTQVFITQWERPKSSAVIEVKELRTHLLNQLRAEFKADWQYVCITIDSFTIDNTDVFDQRHSLYGKAVRCQGVIAGLDVTEERLVRELEAKSGINWHGLANFDRIIKLNY